MTQSDSIQMARALKLAVETAGQASPNPQVGCVLTLDGAVIGEGAHFFDRYEHAETVALKQAGDARGATAYVTLEPCSHHGRTGPCADALIEAGIARCVVATADPNPLVSGRGLAKLQAAGVAVEVGLFEEQARSLNDAFAGSVTWQRPFVTLKSALSVDGYVAPAPEKREAGAPFWLTGAEARAEVQRLRHGSDALVTGIGTALIDDPQLTDRTNLPRRRRLMRVVLDSQLRLPLDSQLVQSAADTSYGDLWVFSAKGASYRTIAAFEQRGVRVTEVETDRDGRLALPEVLAHLHEAKLLSVLLEGGPGVNGAFLAQGLVDRAVLYYAQAELGQGSVEFAKGFPGPFALERQMVRVTKTQVGEDVRVSGLLHDPWTRLANIAKPRAGR